MARGASAQSCHRTVTTEERVLISYHPGGTARGNRPRSSDFLERGLLAYYYSYTLRGRLLIRCTSKSHLSTSHETSEGGHIHPVPLPHSEALAYLRAELLCVSGTPGFTSSAPVFVAATQGTALDHLALVAKSDLHSWVPQNCNNQRQFLAGFHPEGTTRTADWNMTPAFPWKMPICQSWSFSLRS